MKFKFDIKDKIAGFEVDVEKLVEKGMDQHEKDWKDKFNTKHNAKKEIMEIKHKHKMEIENKKQNKMNFFQRIQEEKRKRIELELQEEHRKEEERKKVVREKTIFSIILGIIGGLMIIVGFVLGSATENPDSGLYVIAIVGFIPLYAIFGIWGTNSKRNSKKTKRKNRNT